MLYVLYCKAYGTMCVLRSKPHTPWGAEPQRLAHCGPALPSSDGRPTDKSTTGRAARDILSFSLTRYMLIHVDTPQLLVPPFFLSESLQASSWQHTPSSTTHISSTRDAALCDAIHSYARSCAASSAHVHDGAGRANVDARQGTEGRAGQPWRCLAWRGL